MLILDYIRLAVWIHFMLVLFRCFLFVSSRDWDAGWAVWSRFLLLLFYILNKCPATSFVRFNCALRVQMPYLENQFGFQRLWWHRTSRFQLFSSALKQVPSFPRSAIAVVGTTTGGSCTLHVAQLSLYGLLCPYCYKVGRSTRTFRTFLFIFNCMSTGKRETWITD